MDTTLRQCQAPDCGKTFRPTTPNQRFCPPTDRDRVRAKNSQARSRCARRAKNAKDRGTTTFLNGQPFDCAQCGKRCTPGENVAPHASKFCGKECKAKWHQPRVDWNARRREQWLDGVMMVSKRDETSLRRMLRNDPCCYCGEPSEALDHIVPKTDGGEDGWSNRVGICRQCNSIKGQLPLLSALLFIPPTKEYHRLRRTLYAAVQKGAGVP